MKIFIIFIFILNFLLIGNINSYSTDGADGSCDTKLNHPTDYLTFYGDSLGDFVDSPVHGFASWDNYLKFHDQSIPWGVQNLAVASWTTRSIWNRLKVCFNKDNKNIYRTTNTVALEIGGNDMLYYVPGLIVFPWKFSSYTDPVTGKLVRGAVDTNIHNTRALIRFFRHPLIDKDVLLMGNFPTLTGSPSLGPLQDYFEATKKFWDDKYLKINEDKRIFGENNDLNDIQVFFEFVVKIILEILNLIVDLFNLLLEFLVHAANEIFRINISLSREEVDPNTPLGWYNNWVKKMSADPWSVLSMGMLFSQTGLSYMVLEENEYTKNQVKTYPNPNGGLI